MSDEPVPFRQMHDLKNCIGVIIGFSELLLADTSSGGPQHEGLEEIHKAALTALRLVREMGVLVQSDD